MHNFEATLLNIRKNVVGGKGKKKKKKCTAMGETCTHGPNTLA